jgi:hypothetical protein
MKGGNGEASGKRSLLCDLRLHLRSTICNKDLSILHRREVIGVMSKLMCGESLTEQLWQGLVFDENDRMLAHLMDWIEGRLGTRYIPAICNKVS